MYAHKKNIYKLLLEELLWLIIIQYSLKFNLIYSLFEYALRCLNWLLLNYTGLLPNPDIYSKLLWSEKYGMILESISMNSFLIFLLLFDFTFYTASVIELG